MGMPGPFSSSCAVYDQKSTVEAPNPDPINFKIIQIIQRGKNLVAEIEYPNCTNFEGIKICVYKNLTQQNLEKLNEIDPHFSNKGISPFARFEPTVHGKMEALLLAERI